ncbi:helix-turn-helix transcriptional regulator [Psychrobacter faecalis]|jgi:predicted DNA-binding transcriptional regulator AlpA|uniref:helix-turn-helix transcriptional regulator n=1 Tax=Psychrobacter faecalis TaxID=180588 RepID=UPI0028AC53A4|nr:AlpA family phage regulatory protein [Psychrobacter faecalis]
MLESDTPTKTHKNKDLAKLLPLQGMSRAKNILPLLPFGRTTLHEWSRDGRFPASIRLSPTIVAWKNSEVLEWLENHSNPVNDEQENGCE